MARITNGHMADIVLDTSGLGPKNINPSLPLLRKRGSLLMVSRAGQAEKFDAERVIVYQLTVRGLRGHSYQAVEMALSLMASKRLPLELMSTHLLGLNDVDRALHMVGGQTEDRPIHISVDPWKV